MRSVSEMQDTIRMYRRHALSQAYLIGLMRRSLELVAAGEPGAVESVKAVLDVADHEDKKHWA